MAAEIKSVGAGIACHAWNKDGSLIALSPNSSDVSIYRTNQSEVFADWTLLHTLSEHTEFVSSIDWSPVSDKIVTCGHDRNAYVWSFEPNENKWKPSLVILRINRAATCVRWSPDGKKFAVASGAKVVPVCHYEESNSWWISKMIKKHKSTVLSIAWSPNSKLLITGSTDYKARIFSAFLKEVDTPQDDGFGFWPDQNRFGEVLCEFDQAHAWVHSVAWSASGQRVAFAGHGSTITFVQVGAQPQIQTIRAQNLPFLDIAFLSDQALVGAGFDCSPILFTADASGEWKLQEDLDKREEKKIEAKQSGFATAKNLFQQSVTKGVQINNEQSSKTLEDAELKTKHQNTITSICRYKPAVISTAGIDGRVFFWDLSKIGVDVAGLGIAN